jgi:hypothetical protein
MVVFIKTQPPATVAELEDLERYAKLSFPEAYKQHILRYNGGRCEPNVFYFLEQGQRTSSAVHWFLPTRREGWGSLRDYIETYKIDEKRLPSSLLPIAHDEGGNLICLACAGEEVGRVYFWDHETEVDYTVEADKVRTNLYPIADSIPQFLAALVEEPVE